MDMLMATEFYVNVYILVVCAQSTQKIIRIRLTYLIESPFS